MVSLCWRIFFVLCGFVSERKVIATTLAHRSHGEVSVCTEQKVAAEKISWLTLADIQPTRGVQTCNMVFNITLAGPTCCERVTCECWPASGRHAMQTQKVLLCSLWSFPCHIWCLIQHDWFPNSFPPNGYNRSQSWELFDTKIATIAS